MRKDYFNLKSMQISYVVFGLCTIIKAVIFSFDFEMFNKMFM